MKNWLYPDISAPFLLIEQRNLTAWNGTEEDSKGESDFDRIITLEAPASTVSVGKGIGLVLLGHENPSAIFLPSDLNNNSHIIIPVEGDYPDTSDEDQAAFFRSLISKSQDSDWGEKLCEITVAQFDLALISTLDPGNDLVSGGISIGLDQGTYGVYHTQWSDDDSLFEIFRLRPLKISVKRPTGFQPAQLKTLRQDSELAVLEEPSFCPKGVNFDSYLVQSLDQIELNNAIQAVQNDVRKTRLQHETYRTWLQHSKDAGLPGYLPSYAARTLFLQIRHWKKRDDLSFFLDLALGTDSAKLTSNQRLQIFKMLNDPEVYFDPEVLKGRKSALINLTGDLELWSKREVKTGILNLLKSAGADIRIEDLADLSKTQKFIEKFST